MFVRRKRSFKKGPTEKQTYVPRYQPNLSPQWPLLTQDKEFMFALSQLKQRGYIKDAEVTRTDLAAGEYLFVAQEGDFYVPTAVDNQHVTACGINGVFPYTFNPNYGYYFHGCYGQGIYIAYFINDEINTVIDKNISNNSYSEKTESGYVVGDRVHCAFNDGTFGFALYERNNTLRIIYGNCLVYLVGSSGTEEASIVKIPKNMLNV